MIEYHIPTWSPSKGWYYTDFETRHDFREFLKPLFKEPGFYNFDEFSRGFNEEARKFTEKGLFCEHAETSKVYIDYWDKEKEKCRKGVIFHNDKGDTWYLPRFYYHWVNFLQIYNKKKTVKKATFPEIRDVQYHMSLYECLAELHDKNGCTLKRRQVASEQPHTELLLGEHGWTTMGDVQVGDKIQNPDGTLTTVLYKSDNGVKDVYEFEFMDKRKVRCGIEHNWELVDRSNEDKTIVINTAQILERGVLTTPVKGKLKTYNNYRFSIKPIKPIDFGINNKFIIPPYLMGAFLGDGSINQSMSICGADLEIFDRIRNELSDDYLFEPKLIQREKLGYSVPFYDAVIQYKYKFLPSHKDNYKNGQYGVNPILREMESLGLKVDGKGNKFIPDCYKFASIEDRVALVQGMMDTDGYVNAIGRDIHFTNINKRLVDDFVDVVRSLGIRVTIDEKAPKKGKYNAKKFYRARICGNIKFDIFHLSRKNERMTKRTSKNYYEKIPLISIKKLDYQEQSSCILVDNPNHLYITKDFVPTHNTYLHDAMIFNRYIFEEQFKGKIGASDKKFIEGANGCWRFLADYKNFTDSKTAWVRHNDPDKMGTWIQKVKTSKSNLKDEKTDIYIGTFASISGVTFDKDPASGVGGAIDLFYYEEGGIAPTADETYGYIREAMSEGSEVTGYFTIAGSVGALDQCEPLKKFILDPIGYDFYPVTSTLLNESGIEAVTGLFIPIFWGYVGEENGVQFIDEYGNSLVKEAKEYIDKRYAEEKKKKDPAAYQLLVSQGPRTIAEAFAVRTESIFPLQYTARQQQSIEDKTYWLKNCTLERVDNKIEIKETTRTPCFYGQSKTEQDKRGCVVIHEKFIEGSPWMTYFASVDPIEIGRTATSESLASIYIWKNAVEVQRVNEAGKTEVFLEGGKLVAEYVGRYDDPNETNEMISMLVELYNAWTICENNKNSFINYMRIKRRQRFLAKKTDMLFDKEMQVSQNEFQDYGWTNTPGMWNKIIEYGIDSLSELVSNEFDSEGEITKTHYGHERIPFIGLIKEMQSYNDKGNFDRIVSYCSLMAFVKIQQAARGTRKRIERRDDDSYQETNKQLSDLRNSISPFKHMGVTKVLNNAYQSIKRSAFKNMH